MKGDIKLANVFRNTARYSLLILGILVSVFALISGSEDFGGGISGVVKNSPNALPWLLLLLMLWLAWKHELLGGLVISVSGVVLVIYFNFTGNHFYWSTFLITLLVLVLGLFFLLSWRLRR